METAHSEKSCEPSGDGRHGWAAVATRRPVAEPVRGYLERRRYLECSRRGWQPVWLRIAACIPRQTALSEPGALTACFTLVIEYQQ
jgi:hypothetical protein